MRYPTFFACLLPDSLCSFVKVIMILPGGTPYSVANSLMDSSLGSPDVFHRGFFIFPYLSSLKRLSHFFLFLV